MPLFLALTMTLDDVDKKKIARKALLVSFIILVLFALTGQILFAFFGITVDSFKVVDGIIFFFMGYDMLNSKDMSDSKIISTEDKDIAISPLAIPMIAGPGAITNAII